MANPQKENGFTPIASEILEALARTRIPGEARQVLDVIFRKTYGFNKKEDGISISQFVEATGLKPNHVCKALKTLRKMGIIPLKGNITQKGKAKYTTYCFIKDYQLWQPLPKKGTIPQKENKRFPLRGDTKDIITKENNNKSVGQDPRDPAVISDIGSSAKHNVAHADVRHARNNNIRPKADKQGIADKFVALYREYLVKPGYAADIAVLTPTRIANINARFQQFPNWDDWTKFFRDFIPASKFLRGEIPPSGGHKQFRLDIDWLTNISNFTKIIEKRYHQ